MMATATAKKRDKTGATTTTEVQRLAVELQNAKEELTVVHRFLEKVQTFSDVVTEAKSQLAGLRLREHELKEELSEVRSDIRSIADLIASSNDGMLALIEPGPVEFMPLFDRMEAANPETHGPNAEQWREKPVAVLRLSPAASNLLTEADIVFIGQLQDRILENPEEWWQDVEGLTEPLAAAIADKLADFSSKGGEA